VKRTFDVAASALGLVLTSPFLLAGAIAVKVASPGPAFYRGVRVGRHGKQFQIYKLRTMEPGAEKKGPAVTASDDPRITPVGRALRRTKIDELPQLLNVLKGEMSLVGPRPEHPDYVHHYTPEQRKLLDVRPGITGPAAIAYIDEEKRLEGKDSEKAYLEEVMPGKLELELRYLENASLWSDLGILARTARAIVRRGGG
jgi:lipopolysaccharide/colanic/teichoic acid biosynthesis glycosyltransferase